MRAAWRDRGSLVERESRSPSARMKRKTFFFTFTARSPQGNSS
jgi:hypothetical protein